MGIPVSVGGKSRNFPELVRYLLESGELSGKRIPPGFRPACYSAAGLLLIYGIIVMIPSGNRASYFLPLGAMVAAGRIHGIWTRLRRNDSGLDIRSRVPVIAADLVFLIAVQHGLIQSHIDLDRGNILGAALSMTVVTPILALLARAIALRLGNKVFP